MEFFKHPLIDIIGKHTVMNALSLFTLSGIPSKELFAVTYKKLIRQGHIALAPHERVLPRFLSLSVYHKASHIFMETIDLKYIDRKDLRLIGYDEGKEDFIDGFQLKNEHRGFIESRNDVFLDFDKYNYHLHANYANLAYKEPKRKKPISIVYVDCFSSFAETVERLVKEKYFPECQWNHFARWEEALAFIELKMTTGGFINLIITERFHPKNITGYDFAKSIRNLEAIYNMFPVPIVAMSLVSPDNPILQQGFREDLFVKFIDKGWDSHVMAAYIRNILTPNPYLS